MMHFALGAVFALLATPAISQDISPALDPVWLSRDMSVSAAAEAQARQVARRNSGPRRSADGGGDGADRTCRELPQYRRALGSNDSRVRRLTAMCRQLGYR